MGGGWGWGRDADAAAGGGGITCGALPLDEQCFTMRPSDVEERPFRWSPVN